MSDATTVDDRAGISRRNVLRAGAVGIAAVGVGAGKVLMEPSLANRGLLSPDGVFHAASIALADLIYIEAFPTSPLILNPFSDPLPIPRAATPVPPSVYQSWANPPGPGLGQQNSFGTETHQLWPSAIGFPDPIVYTRSTCTWRSTAPSRGTTGTSPSTWIRVTRTTSPGKTWWRSTPASP